MLYSHIDINILSFPGNLLRNIVAKWTLRALEFDGTSPYSEFNLESICRLALKVW